MKPNRQGGWLWCFLVGLTGWGPSAPAATPLTTTRVATGLTRPLFVTAPPGDTARLFIVEQYGSGGVANRGDIKILNLGTGMINPTPFLSVTGLSTAQTQGLLGLAFAPDYDTTGRFYVTYTDPVNDWHLARGTVSADPDVANAELVEILFVDHPNDDHNGGWLGFGPDDDYLYAALGDGSHPLGGDFEDNGQNRNVFLGKLMRLDVSGATYANPPDNPFFGATPGLDEIWATGLRNPWRPSHDRLTADLWIADVGENSWEEVNFEPASSAGGVNYGWRCREGSFPYAESTTNPCASCNDPECPLTDPIHQYSHLWPLCAVTGGYVYRGCAMPDLRGTYFFADYFCDSSSTAVSPIWSFRYVGGTITEFSTRTTELDPPDDLVINQLTSFGEDGAGELYICKRTGEVYKIVPAAAPDPPTPKDYDNDGDVDLFDLKGFTVCSSGPGVGFPNCLCDVFDDGLDSDVDLPDYAALQTARTN